MAGILIQTDFTTVCQPTNADALAGAITALAGAGVAGALMGAFADMELAEEVLADTLDELDLMPLERERVWRGAFIYLQRGPLLADKGEPIYRAHCAELVRRYTERGDMQAATDAEIAIALCTAALVAPLREAPTSVAILALSKTLPGKWMDSLADWRARGEWDGQLGEIRQDVDKHIRKLWQSHSAGRGPSKEKQ